MAVLETPMPKQGDHHLGLKVLFTLEADAFCTIAIVPAVDS